MRIDQLRAPLLVTWQLTRNCLLPRGIVGTLRQWAAERRERAQTDPVEAAPPAPQPAE